MTGRDDGATAGRAAALAAFDRRDDTADLAVLTAETAPAAEPSRDSGDGHRTTLRFGHDGLSLDLRVRARGPHRSLSGLVGGDFTHADLEVRRPGSVARVRVGTDGTFSVEGLERGPLSIAVHRTGRRPVVTGWFTV
ncbi:hypothetical protein [Nocardiopsis sp. LOL_012]|uniref:hypothetical protein n=1 Tax=Nocardiopsis sp. LOL_012 TaxID=3345409 RepID=UPI003A840A2F